MKITKITKCTRVPMSATASTQLDSGWRFFFKIWLIRRTIQTLQI
jgi:hypothetical protein